MQLSEINNSVSLKDFVKQLLDKNHVFHFEKTNGIPAIINGLKKTEYSGFDNISKSVKSIKHIFV